MNMKPVWLAMFSTALLAGLPGCEREGTLERAGEEADEAVDTLKEGEESTATKVDDAVDEAREGAKETAEEVREE